MELNQSISIEEVLLAYNCARNTLSLLKSFPGKIHPAVIALIQIELQRADKILDCVAGISSDEYEDAEPVLLNLDPYEEIARLKERVEKLLEENKVFKTLSWYQVGFHDGQAVSYADPGLWDAAENLLKNTYPTGVEIVLDEGQMPAVLVPPSAISGLKNALMKLPRPQLSLSPEEDQRFRLLACKFNNLSPIERDEFKQLSTRKYGPSQFTFIEDEWMRIVVQEFLEKEKSNQEGKE